MAMDLTAGRAGTAGRWRESVRHLDVVLLLTVLALSVFGLLMVYSSTHQTLTILGDSPYDAVRKQGFGMVLASGLLAAAAAADYRQGKVYAPIAYVGVLVLLLLVKTPLGQSTAGAQRGFKVAGFQFTPSEFSKIALILMLAAFLSELRTSEITLRTVFRATALAALPMVLVFLQPDLGTSLVLAVVLVTVLVVAGARARHLGALALVAVVLMFGAFRMGIVKDYQIQRLTALFDAKDDPLRSGYNRLQSEIAIGSGGLTGVGYLQGTQTNLDFVPEQHTDFIFTVVGEELGFMGAVFLLSLFAVLLWRTFRIAALSKDRFGTYVAGAIGGVFAFQMFVNIGMTLGIMPITGIPLPFVSFGGSSLLANYLMVGILLSVHMRRFTA
ncbi:MAG: rod shape-determining protein RodA [Actinobacteria bacterium]|nr:rod shape-determining protein RodA [Actinomycetota bacterium]